MSVGFGDFVALQTNEALNTNVFYVVLSMTFILFGLTVVASSMNLLVLRFLTMNTEDERREEIQSAVARNSIHFDGDLITPNGEIRLVRTAHAASLLSRHSHFLFVSRTARVSHCRTHAGRIRAVPLLLVFQAEEERSQEVHRAPHAGQGDPPRAHAALRLDHGSSHALAGQTVHDRLSPSYCNENVVFFPARDDGDVRREGAADLPRLRAREPCE